MMSASLITLGCLLSPSSMHVASAMEPGNRRLQHRLQAAETPSPDDLEPLFASHLGPVDKVSNPVPVVNRIRIY